VLTIATIVCAAPALAVLIQAGFVIAERGAALTDPLLLDAVWGTVALVVFGAAGATILGASAAWLISHCHFPGHGVLSWALVLPLAAPAYVLAYAYGALTGPLGPVPIGLSGGVGAVFVYTIAFYPYVYIAARAAFATQSVCAVEAARSLGASPWRALITITGPLAWPAIAAGAALCAMEISADYGAASYFGATTLSTAVFRAWNGHADTGLAVQIAAILLVGAGVLMLGERRLRGARAFSGGSTRWRETPSLILGGWKGLAASGFCIGLVMAGVGLPVVWLIRLAAFGPPDQWQTLLDPLGNTLVLATMAAIATLAVSALIAMHARRRFGNVAAAAATAGYAAPGAVMALGGLMVMAAAREAGLVGGLGAGLALLMLVWIYVARFAAAGVGPIDAALHAVTPRYVQAARTLGASRMRRLFAIETPIAAPGVIAAGLILFVEVLKELPATLILRPFDFDTLAVVAHQYASDDRLNAAALPALMILAAGLLPVMVMMKRLSKARAGAEQTPTP
jgi:iron(III) transport system permease protein